MRRCRLFSAVLATAAGSLLFWCAALPAQAQKMPKRCLPHPAATRPPQLFIDQVTFEKTDFPDGVDQAQLVATLKERALNGGADWLPRVSRAVKEAWQDAGYFQAVPTLKSRVTGGGAGGRHVALTIHVDPGPQYRLSRIRIRTTNPGGKLVFSEETLRKMIPLNYGEILNVGKIREGLREIQKYYATRGYIDMAATPGFHIHSKIDRVSIYVFLDQGRQYRVGKMTILGLDPSMESLLRSKLAPGDIFNWDRVLDFYQSQQPVLPPHASPGDDEVYRVPKTDKVDVWLDFRSCPAPAQANPASSARVH
jgi:Surface antigen variable number repeat